MFITKKSNNASKPCVSNRSSHKRENTLSNQSHVLKTEYNDLNCNNKQMGQKDMMFLYQKGMIHHLKSELGNSTKQHGKRISLRKASYEDYDRMRTNSATLDTDNKRLQDKNRELIETISHKDNLITQYKEIVHQSSSKTKKLEEMNELLNQQIRSQDNIAIRHDSIMPEGNPYHNHNCHKKNNNYANEYKSPTKTKDKNRKKKDYNQFLMSNRTQTNDELKYSINILQREKDTLLKDKVRDHKEIIRLREMTYNSCNTSGNYLNIKTIENNTRNKSNNTFFENDYMKEITRLHGIILDREAEIESIKQNMSKKIREISLEKEAIELRYNKRSYSHLPINKNIHNVYYYK